MRNLLERMKPEPLAKFNKAKEKNPTVYSEIEQELKKANFVIHIQFGTVITLCQGLNLEHPFKMYDIFND
jgi:hypothetical protein